MTGFKIRIRKITAIYTAKCLCMSEPTKDFFSSSVSNCASHLHKLNFRSSIHLHDEILAQIRFVQASLRKWNWTCWPRVFQFPYRCLKVYIFGLFFFFFFNNLRHTRHVLITVVKIENNNNIHNGSRLFLMKLNSIQHFFFFYFLQHNLLVWIWNFD